MKKRALTAILISLTILFAACGGNKPPEDGTPDPEPHNGEFVSEFGTLRFNGDGDTLQANLSSELAEAAGLPAGEQEGTYVFLFHHGAWRYDKAESFRITLGGKSYDFMNIITQTDENTIAVLSPMNDKETILFKKEEE